MTPELYFDLTTAWTQARGSVHTNERTILFAFLTRAHVPVGQLVPGAGEGAGELVRILQNAARDVAGHHAAGDGQARYLM